MPALILDIGGIFFAPRWREEGVAKVASILNISTEKFTQLLKENKKDFYIGNIAEEEFWALIIAKINASEMTVSDMKKLYRSFITPIKDACDILPELAKKYVLISCNNSPIEWMDERVRIASLQNYFTDFCTSGYVGYEKPSPQMFSAAVKMAKKHSESITYYDDNESYVNAFCKEFPQYNGVHCTSHLLLTPLVR